MKFAVISFPGSSGDVDALHAVEEAIQADVVMLSSSTTESLTEFDVVILPGGASYGNYLRPGALASLEPVLPALLDYAKEGGIIVGFDNGFQILTEMGLLPGAFMINPHLKFINQVVKVKVEKLNPIFTNAYTKDQVLNLPLANKNANYYLSETEIKQLEESGQILFRYQAGHPTNSALDIAGITNQAGNILGLMPHAERAVETLIHNEDGIGLFQSLHNYLSQQSVKEEQV